MISNHPVKDLKAKQWLDKNLLNPSVIYKGVLRGGKLIEYEYAIWHNQGLKEIETIEEFISLFPDSSFTPWAKLYLANWINMGVYYSYSIRGERRFTYYSSRERSRKRYNELQKAEKIIKSLIDKNNFPNDTFKERALTIEKKLKGIISHIESLGFNVDF